MQQYNLFGNSRHFQSGIQPMLVRSLSLLLGIIIVTGCAVSPGYETSRGGGISKGDQVIINQQISVPSGSKIYFQNGQTSMYAGIRQAAPYCYFHINRPQSVMETPASLSADQLTVASVSHYFSAAQVSPEPVVIAAMGFLRQDASQQTLLTRLRLNSSLQPEVIGLFCGIWAVPYERTFLSLQEIRSALGNLVSLNLNTNQP